MPVGADQVPSESSLLHGADAADRGARGGIARIGLELDPQAIQPFECVSQQQQLGGGVHRAALPIPADKRPADFDPPVFRGNSAESGGADDLVAHGIDDRERQRLALDGVVERGSDERIDCRARFQRLGKPAGQPGPDR